MECGETLDRAARSIEETGQYFYLPEVSRVRGEFQWQSQNDPDGALASFDRGLNSARQQTAKSWELRLATSKARLLAELDRRDEALALLAPVYDWFAEGFELPDLTDAKSLLEKLA